MEQPWWRRRVCRRRRSAEVAIKQPGVWDFSDCGQEFLGFLDALFCVFSAKAFVTYRTSEELESATLAQFGADREQACVDLRGIPRDGNELALFRRNFEANSGGRLLEFGESRGDGVVTASQPGSSRRGRRTQV